MKIFGKELRFNNNKAYHTGYKSKASDIYFENNKSLQFKFNEGTLSEYANVLDYGIIEGLNADIDNNTSNFMKMIEECKNIRTIYFPAGVFLLKEINFGVKNNISIKGVSSSFASFINKNINTGEITDTFTKIVCCASEDKPFFSHENCVFVFENIGFYNVYKEKGTGNKKNVFLNTTKTNKEKGKIFATNCGFSSFKVCFGDKYTFQYMEKDLGTFLSEPSSFLQTCVVANRCRFTGNGIAINQNVDGRIVDCSFNKNDFAMVFRENSGFTTIIASRIEWNTYNGLYIDNAHDITVSINEFDRQGYAGLYITSSNNCTITCNMYRRNGANTNLATTDYEHNVHMYINNCYDCIIEGNNTVAKQILDTSTGGATRPSNVSNFSNNTNCIYTNNLLTGCSKSNKVAANKVNNNTDCITSNNIPNTFSS